MSSLRRHPAVLAALAAAVLIVAAAGLWLAGRRTAAPSPQEPVAGLPQAGAAAANLDLARSQAAAAARRAAVLEARARDADAAVARTLAQGAALAARVQETEARIAAEQAEGRRIALARAGLAADLARRRAPLARLTAELERIARRPPVLALLRPGSMQEAAHARALLETTLPAIRAQTQDLRARIEASHRLADEASAAAARLERERGVLEQRRTALAALEQRQRIAARQAGGSAARQSDRALALAERTRDLAGLVEALDRQEDLARRLAALPGPTPRPADLANLAPPAPARAAAPATGDPGPPATPGAPVFAGGGYVMPLDGRLVRGFDAPADPTAFGGRALPPTRGLVLAARPHAQVVAPAAGTVAFAGPYRGYGQIVIVEHPGGWTSLVTGLARLSVSVGDALVAGSPLGTTGPGEPLVTLELRFRGEPVNPLDSIRPL